MNKIWMNAIRAAAGAGSETVPVAPSDLTATPVSTAQVDLSWTDNATNETGYKIYRSDNGGAYNLIDTITADSTSYNDTTITAGAAHFYKVAAYNGAGETESNAAGANTMTLNILSYYKCEEASGTRVDAVGNHNLAGSSGSPGSGTGIVGNGIQGNGTDWLLKTGLSESLQTNGFTVWGWVYVTSFTGRKGIIQNGSAMQFRLTVESATQIAFNVADSVSGTTAATILGLSLPLNTWIFVWGRYDASTKKAEAGYNAASGTLAPTALANGATAATAIELARGAATIMNNAISDEIGFALRKYTDDEISSLYNGGAGNQYPFY